MQALRQIAFQLERSGAPTYRVRAFRRAAEVVAGLGQGELAARVEAGTLRELAGVGEVTAQVIAQAAAGQEPEYLTRLLDGGPPAPPSALRAALKGDCHAHSDWSDGGSPPLEMALAARDLGHEWMALTDHSPRLTVAHGLSADRLRAQLELIRELNAALAPFRILSGIEVDILDDGSLDQTDELLGRLDVVVASVHSKLRMPSVPMTERMLAAIANPHTDVLGHCTGRLLTGRGRPQSEFDAEAVFTACRDHGVAVEINCRPERQDPPDDLLRLAVEIGCVFAIDTDAHAPGQLDWLDSGCDRAERFGIGSDRVINTRCRGLSRVEVEVAAMLVPAIVEVLAGLIVVWVAIRGWQGRLPRTGAVGVRTPSTMRSDAAFETANKAAAPLAVAGGAVLTVGGVLAAVLPRHLFGACVFGGVGVFLVLCLLGAATGVRASRSVP